MFVNRAAHRLLGFSLGLLLSLSACSQSEAPVPRSALTYFRDGNTAYQLRDFPTAIWNFQQAISLDDETPSFYYNLGLAYFQSGDYEQALRAFEDSLEIDPNQADTHYNLALVHYQMRNSDKANRHYNRYQILLQKRSAVEAPVAQSASPPVPTPPRTPTASAAASAEPPPAMVQQLRQQLQQQFNGAQAVPKTAVSPTRPTTVQRPQTSGPPKTQPPSWD